MKLARLGDAGAEIPVALTENGAFDLRPVTDDIDGSFLASGGIDRVRDEIASGSLQKLENVEELRVGAPLARPGKVVCIGLNYRDHATETGAAIPAEPVVFLKDPGTVVGPYDDVRIPRGSVKTDWEVELAVVIGRPARYLDDADDALAYVAGYAISNDVSEREFQLERGGQWDKGKSCETFNPLGPWLVPASDIPDPQRLALRLAVNGDARQHGNTSNMVFTVAEIIRYLSHFMVLQPGDVINTGTPAGVALGMADQCYLRAGDVMELEIEGLGTARQRLVDA
ncbi:fumarylacetoacetate hydrolase family protein [Microbacterium sp. E-13]|uniref:fumarylacetoacetate hydrolase family protein n=1 Tax=Microbacterium sp. E-13 TaxID=3404048 RepID=UPI003CF11D22